MNLKELKNRLLKTAEESDLEEELSLDFPPVDNSFENGRFLNSVEQLTEEDIDTAKESARHEKLPFGEIVRKLLLLAFSAVFLVSCGLLIKNIMSKYKAIEIYNQLEEEFFGAGFNFDITNVELVDDGAVSRLSTAKTMTTLRPWTVLMSNSGDQPEGGEKKEYNEELEKMRAGLASLARINSDIYGWITVEGTQINYPLVQGLDNAYYLDHAYTGVYLPEGSIFVDYRNKDCPANNYNTVFYGHNLTSGGMFHDVTKFAKEEYMNEKLIYVYTYDGVFIYEPFSFYESRFDYQYFQTGFSDDEAFVNFASEVQNNSAVASKNIVFTKNDRLLTLSTCTNGYYTQRYALHARLIDSITD